MIKGRRVGIECTESKEYTPAFKCTVVIEGTVALDRSRMPIHRNREQSMWAKTVNEYIEFGTKVCGQKTVNECTVGAECTSVQCPSAL